VKSRGLELFDLDDRRRWASSKAKVWPRGIGAATEVGLVIIAASQAVFGGVAFQPDLRLVLDGGRHDNDLLSRVV
jgi:hypothetical protein